MYKILVITIIILLTVAGCSAAPAAMEKPVINSFTVDPPTISPGEATMLSWNVSNAFSVEIDRGIGSVARASGSKVVSPVDTQTYTLTATNSAGSLTKDIVINVVPKSVKQPAALAVTVPPDTPPPALPIIVSFIATSSHIKAGSSSMLMWNVTNATTVTINNNVGSVSQKGSETVWPRTTRTYTLTASNSAGSATKSTVINVSQ